MPRLLACALCLLLGHGSAEARPEGATFDAAEKAIRELRYEEARSLLDGALQRGHLAREDLITLYALRGQVAAVVDDAAAGESEFRRLLVLAPDHAPPRATPVVSTPFGQARRWVAAHGHLQVGARAPAEPRAGAPIRISLSVVSDPFAMVDAARIAWRIGSEPFVVTPSTGLRAVLPPQSAGAVVDYYVEVLDASENVLLSVGNPDEPLHLALPRPAPAPVLLAPPAEPAITRAPAIERARPAPSGGGRAGWAAGGTFGALGVGALLGAVGLDVTGRNQYNNLLSTCAPSCNPSDVDRLHQQERAAIGLYVGAGAALATAVVVLAVQAARDHARHHRAAR